MFQIWYYNKELERQQEENAKEGENLGLDEKTGKWLIWWVNNDQLEKHTWINVKIAGKEEKSVYLCELGQYLYTAWETDSNKCKNSKERREKYVVL